MQGDNTGTQGGSMNNNNPKQSGLSWSQPSSVVKPAQTVVAASTPKSTPMLKPAMPAAGQGGNRKLVMLFAGGVVVGGLLAWSWFSLMPAKTATEDDSASTVGGKTGSNNTPSTGTGSGVVTLPGTVIDNETLVVPPLQDAGLSVMVSSASIISPTWIVVYESNNGVRGNALGAALFFPQGGAKTVNLLRTTQAGKTYFVGRHVDNGDKQFSLTLDQPVVNAAGNPVYVEFRTR